MLMTPYRGKRYHLKEWARGNQRYVVNILFLYLPVCPHITIHHSPQDAEELFNLRHAQARNVVERILGVLKRRFVLLEASPEYPFDMQARFIPALGAVHNFLRIHDPSDEAIPNGSNLLTLTQTEGMPPNNTLKEDLSLSSEFSPLSLCVCIDT